MKKLVLLALPAALIASPAFAQASGAVGVDGVVGSRCSALTPITGSFDLGELTLTNGKVDPAFTNHVDPLTKSFTVVCNSANANVSIEADPLDNIGDATTGGGYRGRVHYTASTVFHRSDSSTHTYIYGTTNAGGTLAAPLGGRLANQADNVVLTISNGRTDGSDLLKQGTYHGEIRITISPL